MWDLLHPLPPHPALRPGEHHARPPGLHPQPERPALVEGKGQRGMGSHRVEKGEFVDEALGAIDTDGDLTEVDRRADEVGQI